MNGKGLKGTMCTNNSPELGLEKNINDNVRMNYTLKTDKR